MSNTREHLHTTKSMALEKLFIQTGVFMKANFIMISHMERDTYFTQTTINTKAILWKAGNRAKVVTTSLMAPFSKEYGRTI